jgi:hypothetical protein
MPAPTSAILPRPNASSKTIFVNHMSTKKQMNNTLQNSHDFGMMKFDLQLLLERQSLNETWNKLVKNGLLTSDQINLNVDGINNKTIGSPSGNFPCACCDGECDLKCQTLSQNSTSSERPVVKFLNSWAWNKDVGKFHFIMNKANNKNNILFFTKGLDSMFEFRKNLELQLEDLCTKSAQSTLCLQNLLKQLTLFRRHIEEIGKVRHVEDSRARIIGGLNKDELDKSNVQRKW